MSPKIDFCFKELMENTKIRIGFLSAVLNLSPGQIKSTRLLNTNLRREHEEEKQGILDVRLTLNNDMEIDIEIQLAKLKVWGDRSLFYLSKMYAEQIGVGEKYTVFKKCISISILDFTLFEDTNEFYSCFHIREDKRNTILTDKMEFHVLELSKLPKDFDKNNSILLWAKFINAESEEEFLMVAKENSYIEEAYHQLTVISQDKEKRLQYEARQKAIWDHNTFLFEAEQRGEERGQYKSKVEIVKNAFHLGLPMEQIMLLTGLSQKNIEEIQATIEE